MIKLKTLLLEFDANRAMDWIERHGGKLDAKNRLLAYHGTTSKNAKLIQKSGFKSHTYFSLHPEYSRRITSIYHDIPENKVVVMQVYLPLDSIDFCSGDIYSIKNINYHDVV